MTEHQNNAPDAAEAELQAWLRQDEGEQPAAYDPDQSLRKVLSHAKQQTATRDLVTFFMSWFWLLFAGFGASVYGASQRRHGPVRSRVAKPRPASSSVPPEQKP